jgi:hypothetical protein
MNIMRQLALTVGLGLTGSVAGSVPGWSAPLSVPQDAAAVVRNYVSPPSPKVPNSTAPNEGRAELFFGTMGEIGGKAAAGAISGAIGAAEAGGAAAGASAAGGTLG